jgi:phosphate-selective porin OprO/OprP
MNRGRQLLHLGLSYGHKFRNNDPVRFRQRPEAHLSPVRFVDTASFASDGIDLINPEVALVYGPFSLQGEYLHAFAQASEAKDPDFDGVYVYGSYFLTGENRVYKTSDGAFDRVNPSQNFDGNGGLGAWEVGLRYSHLDFDENDFSAGELGDLTVGINWYLNPNVRFMWNYVLADLDDVGDTNIFQTRFQVDF